MDKNIAAILRPNARTVMVSYTTDEGARSIQTYKFVTTISDLKEGDYVVVPSKINLPIVVCIDEVHNDLQIAPNEQREYKWVMGKIDMAGYEKLMADNKTLTDTIGQAYQANVRKQFADALLNGLSDEARENITALLK